MKSSRDWGTGGAQKSTKDWSTPAGSANTGGGQWGRLRPPPQKESEFGFVSKGDSAYALVPSVPLSEPDSCI